MFKVEGVFCKADGAGMSPETEDFFSCSSSCEVTCLEVPAGSAGCKAGTGMPTFARPGMSSS